MNRKNERVSMVETQIAARGITDRKILKAFKEIPRHLFVPDKYSEEAYCDCPLPIGEGQTISQPLIVAEMTQLLNIKQGDKVLEIGTGSGYQSAILAYLGAQVYTMERIKTLMETAKKTLDKLIETESLSMELDVHFIEGDGTIGCGEYAPYNGIVVTAAAPEVPETLLEQLGWNGRLVIPVGSRISQILKVYEKVVDGIKEYSYGGCMFVPLIGKYGWQKKE